MSYQEADVGLFVIALLNARDFRLFPPPDPRVILKFRESALSRYGTVGAVPQSGHRRSIPSLKRLRETSLHRHVQVQKVMLLSSRMTKTKIITPPHPPNQNSPVPSFPLVRIDLLYDPRLVSHTRYLSNPYTTPNPQPETRSQTVPHI